MSLYLIILIILLAGLLTLSFDKSLRLYKHWKDLLSTFLLTMVVFMLGNIIFTHIEHWFFNLLCNFDIYINKLPLENHLFFMIIPYACVFLFYGIQFYFPKFKLNEQSTKVLTFLIVAALLLTSFLNLELTYTFVNFILLSVLLLLSCFFVRELVQYYLARYSILPTPFIIINGILRDIVIEQAIFDYNPQVIFEINALSFLVEGKCKKMKNV